MAADLEIRKYKISDAELCMFTSNLCNTLIRDMGDMVAFGLTPNDVSELKMLGDSFEIFQPDATFIGDVMIAGENKSALRNEILETIRNMAMRVKMKWGADSANYKRLDFNNPSLLTDDLLLIVSRDMHAKMTEFLPDLLSLGLTQIILNEWAGLNDNFEISRQAMLDATVKRVEKTSERITKGNELYDLVSRYCSFGKRVYENTSPAKYNDYLIYQGKYKKKKKKTDE